MTRKWLELLLEEPFLDPVMADFAKYGFCAALAKPVQMQELREVVGRAIAG
ncbi:MAG: hypothetical protein J7L25_10180 [Deltaproteobacteria bacterium]|nr:hypothetical protein [Candidatus Tharpella aukensis]